MLSTALNAIANGVDTSIIGGFNLIPVQIVRGNLITEPLRLAEIVPKPTASKL